MSHGNESDYLFHPIAVSLGRSSVAGSNASKRTKILLKKKNLVLALVVSKCYMTYTQLHSCNRAYV